jgi:hypothetical protein
MKQHRYLLSMFSITSPVADAIFTYANILLVVGAVLAFVGTAGVFWSTGIRERFADERIAANEAETARAKAEAAQARLEQERLKAQMAWRRVSPAQAQLIAGALQGKKLEFWLTYVGNDPEATIFREDLDQALTAAGCKTKLYSGYARAIGVGVRGGQPEERRLLIQAFTKAGLPLMEVTGPGFMKDELEILVGTKAPPEFQR